MLYRCVTISRRSVSEALRLALPGLCQSTQRGLAASCPLLWSEGGCEAGGPAALSCVLWWLKVTEGSQPLSRHLGFCEVWPRPARSFGRPLVGRRRMRGGRPDCAVTHGQKLSIAAWNSLLVPALPSPCLFCHSCGLFLPHISTRHLSWCVVAPHLYGHTPPKIHIFMFFHRLHGHCACCCCFHNVES